MTAAARRLVVVPGLGLDARSWSAVLRRLPASSQAAVLPLPGMGLRKPVPALEVLAEEVRRRLGEGPVVLVGHSQGSQVVAAVAARDPRVVAVVLLGPTTDPRLLRTVRGLLPAWLRTAVHEPLRQVPAIVAQWLHTGPRAMRALWRRAAPDRIERWLAEVSVPVTVVRGTRDRLCGARWARVVAGAAPRGRLVEVPGGAHMLPMTHPAAVAEVLITRGDASSQRSVRPRTSA